ncbi:hypothetical protein KW805_02620 [Candidatus Pacearchaeota archaeon]|nr:hypothetical protein [Candidatus Pacearchaeota archaeon]
MSGGFVLSKGIMDNYIQLVERIASAAHVEKDEIERKVEAKRAKLSGLVSKEGAAQIVAAELGINFDKERLKISELVQGMKRANIVGKIIETFPIISFNKNGKEGKVARVTVADDSSNTKVVLWDTHHISLVEGGELKEGDVIEVSNASVRNGELHLSSFSDIKKSSERIDAVVTKKPLMMKKLQDVKPGESLKTRALIVQTFDPRYFEVCPQCGKKVAEDQCINHGKVKPLQRALLNLVLDDGTESLRAVIFGEHIYKLGLTQEEVFSLERFSEKKHSLLGEERFFVGNVRNNALFNTMEFSVDHIEDVNVDLLIHELEAKQ